MNGLLSPSGGDLVVLLELARASSGAAWMSNETQIPARTK